MRFVGYAAFALGIAVLASSPVRANPDLVSNGGFEKGVEGWAWMTAGGARASGALDTREKHGGTQSYRLSSDSDQTPNVYGRIYRTIYGLRPFTTYRIHAWVKGRGVGNAWIGGGPGWYLRQPVPEGDFDWREIVTEYTTGQEAGDFELMVLVESRTQALWVDDIEMREVDADIVRRAQAEQSEQTSLDAQRDHLTRVRQMLQTHPRWGDDRYIALGINIAERFLARVQRPAAELHQSSAWSRLQLEEVERVLDETERRMTQAAPIAPPAGKERPRYLGGYGHFGSVASDIPNFPGLGVSIIQQERGPSVSESADGRLSDAGRSIVDTLQSADRSHIKVDLLLSPHYFPDWAVRQAPDVLNGNPGFIGFNIDHPVARTVIQRHLQTLPPAIKGQPALFSLCLSNEPVYASSGRDTYSRPLWTRYLRRQHGTITALNTLYGTRYTAFEDVPVPPPGMPEEIGARRAYYDWVRFNQQHFADWHRWMSDLARKQTPGVPTHAKIMVFNTFERSLLHYGVDPELFCDATDIAGCDAYAFLRSDLLGRFERHADISPEGERALSEDYVYNWQGQEMFYDLLHSFRGQQVFNSENHLIPDGSPAQHVPPEHTRAALWQGGLHHQGATTIWVWEDSAEPSLAGSIFFRPANIYAAGRALLDLDRLADEVTAIDRQQPRTALLYSMPSIFWEGDYGGTVGRLYTALSFLGEPVTFVSERQLQSGRYPKLDRIIVPHATHVGDATVAALQRFARRGGRLLLIGDGDLSADEYSRPRNLPSELMPAPMLDGKGDKAAFLRSLRAAMGSGVPTLLSAATGQPTWGVEYRVVRNGKRLLVPLINFLPETQTVRLDISAPNAAAVDLLSGERIDLKRITLSSLEPRLLQIRE